MVVMESLAKQGHEIYLLDDDPYCAGFRSKYCKEGIVSPSEEDADKYIDAITAIVLTRRFDLLIPVSDIAVELLSTHRQRVSAHVPMFLPSKELINLACFKDRTYRFALDKDILIPRTYFPISIDDIVRLSVEVNYPCMVKRSRGTGNKGNTYISDKEQLINYYQLLTQQDDWPVIQEYIVGDFYGFLAVADQGEVLDCLTYKTDQKYAASVIAPYCFSVVDENFLDTAKRIIKLLNWSGAVNLDFMKGPDGRFFLLEINPRLSGSVNFAYQLGVDLPLIYTKLALGQLVNKFERIRYPSGVIFRFVLTSEIIFTIKNKDHLRQLLGNFFKGRIMTDIPWHDPKRLMRILRHLWWYWRARKREKV